MKYPNWDHAPEWANWTACDKSGRWYWHEKQPYPTDEHWRGSQSRYTLAYSGTNYRIPVPNPNWQNSLQPRPFAPSWDDAPDWAVYAIQEKNSSGNWYWQATADQATGIRAATNPYPKWRPKKTTLLRRPTNRPDWSEAPSWANWIAQDEDGEWRWHETEPKIQESAYLSDLHTSEKRVQTAKFGEPHPGWKENVVRRPQPKAPNNKPSWDDAPPEAQWLAQDNDGTWYWYEARPRAYDGYFGLAHIIRPSAGEGTSNPDWKSTLEPRPQPKVSESIEKEIELLPGFTLRLSIKVIQKAQ